MRRAAVATRALAARVNLWTVRPAKSLRSHVSAARPAHVTSNPFGTGVRPPSTRCDAAGSVCEGHSALGTSSAFIVALWC